MKLLASFPSFPRFSEKKEIEEKKQERGREAHLPHSPYPAEREVGREKESRTGATQHAASEDAQVSL